MKKTLFVLLGFALLSASGCRQRQLSGDFTCTTNDSAITITGYTGATTVVTIPDMIDGLPVISIGESAFYSCSNLISVTIPNSVTRIEGGAFLFCTNLASVMISGSVTNIGNSAFRNCSKLTCITIPDSVTSIEDGAFYSCTCLTNIAVDVANVSYSSMDGVLFNKNRTTLIQCPGGKAGNYAIKNSVTSIGEAAFIDCKRLTSVTIPDSVTNIDWETFRFCSNLASITIPNSVTNIGGEAFASCRGLTSVYFEGNAPSIGLHMFDQTTNATVYYLPGTTGWGPTFGGLPTRVWQGDAIEPHILTPTNSSGVAAKFISREKAIQIAKDTAIADKWQIDDYTLRSVEECTNKCDGVTEWLVIFDGNRPAFGNHFGVFVDKKTSKAFLVPGM